MEQYFNLIKSHNLFKGLTDEEIEIAFKNFPYRICEYKSGEKIAEFSQQEQFSLFVLSGSLHVEKYNYDGSREIITTFYQGSMGKFPPFVSYTDDSRISIVSNNESIVLYMRYEDFIKPDYSIFSVQYKLMRNIIYLLDEINQYSYDCKLVLSERSIRKKIVRYLEIYQSRYNSNEFSVLYSRAELADCLCVDKSALSRELGKMKKEGLIDFKGNHFFILKDLRYV